MQANGDEVLGYHIVDALFRSLAKVELQRKGIIGGGCTAIIKTIIDASEVSSNSNQTV